MGQINNALNTLEGLEDILGKNVAQWLSVLGYSLKGKLLVLKGDIRNAEILFTQKIRQDKNHAFEKYFCNISFARYLLAQHKNKEALSILKELSIGLKRDNAIELLIEVELLKSKAYSLSNLKAEALDAVIRAIQFAQSENFVRTFVCEGEEVEKLITEIAKEKLIRSSGSLNGLSKDYLSKLTTAFELEKKQVKMDFAEDLSSREIEVLKLLSNKLSNNEISENLYISLSTVKTHISHILSKLGAKNRQEASEIAIEKGIL
ncbi:MAG: hypothetical protein DWQ02_00550 [Bacteroidetes bacterium]|nr:MAG: hypothetical protein DWQ02_00550 [Bacteroidota bacterium]